MVCKVVVTAGVEPTWVDPTRFEILHNHLATSPIETGRKLKAGGGFRGGQLGATAPLHDETSAWRPLFGKKGTPYPDQNALLFLCFILNVGNI